MQKKIDGHFHVNFCGFSAEDIIKYLDQKKIEQCWLFSWEEKTPPIPSLYKHLPIEDILEAYDKYPDRFVPFYAPDPGDGDIKETLTKYMQLGVRGCGELKVTYRWEDQEIENYLKCLSDLKIPLVFHMEEASEHYVKLSNNKIEAIIEQLLTGAFNGVSKHYLTKIAKYIPVFSKRVRKGQQYFPGYLYDFAYLEKRIKQFPEIKFIGHGPHFWNNLSNTYSSKYRHQRGKIKEFGIIDKLLESYDNFYCDISGKSGYNALTRDKKKFKIFLEKHAQKIIFGTDNTLYDFDMVLDAYNLSKSKLNDIYYNNATNIFH